MTTLSLVTAVAPRAGKIIKMARVFLKKEAICYKMVYYTCIYVKPIVRNVLQS